MSRRLQKIEDVVSPEIGRYYLVPCVARQVTQQPGWMKFWPVIGPWHEDKDIGVAAYHFHYDVRFLPQRVIHPEGPARNLTRVHSFRDDLRTKDNPHGLQYRRLKMKRPMPEFPAYQHGLKSNLTKTLEAMFEDAQLKCRTCPHRGFSLDGLPVAPDGTVVCNGHGLKWNLATGEMVPR